MEQKKLIKVKAIKLGYYGNMRRREGAVFDMEMEIYHPPGNAKPCQWVEPVEGFEVDQNSGQVVAKTRKARSKEIVDAQ